MITFEILPQDGKTCFLVGYIDLSLKEHAPNETEMLLRALGKHPQGQNILFENLGDAQRFIDRYLEHLALYLAKAEPPKEGWIWTQP